MNILAKITIPVLLLILSGCAHHGRYSTHSYGAGYGVSVSGYNSHHSYPVYTDRHVYVESPVIHDVYIEAPVIHDYRPHTYYEGNHYRHNYGHQKHQKPYVDKHYPYKNHKKPYKHKQTGYKEKHSQVYFKKPDRKQNPYIKPKVYKEKYRPQYTKQKNSYIDKKYQYNKSYAKPEKQVNKKVFAKKQPSYSRAKQKYNYSARTINAGKKYKKKY